MSENPPDIPVRLRVGDGEAVIGTIGEAEHLPALLASVAAALLGVDVDEDTDVAGCTAWAGWQIVDLQRQRHVALRGAMSEDICREYVSRNPARYGLQRVTTVQVLQTVPVEAARTDG